MTERGSGGGGDRGEETEEARRGGRVERTEKDGWREKEGKMKHIFCVSPLISRGGEPTPELKKKLEKGGEKRKR